MMPSLPRRTAACLLLAATALLVAPAARAETTQQEAQALVDRATLSLQEIFADGADARGMLRKARAVMVCPRILRAGFMFGGQGGSCVLLARDGAGSWSSPAFYTMASASFGLQAGVQDMQVIMMVQTTRALDALLNNHFKIGADASASVATVGTGISGATTSAVGADIVAIARARGLFAGVALEGSLLNANEDAVRSYYGQAVSPREIVQRMAVHNPGADPLRAALMRYGTPVSAQAAPASPPPATLNAAPAVTAPASRTPVTSTGLPPVNSR